MQNLVNIKNNKEKNLFEISQCEQNMCIILNDDKYYTEQIKYEPLLDESNRRFTLFPIKYPKIWDEYKKQEKSFWTLEEINFSQDYKHFETLDPNKKHVIKMILAFFASMDGIVNFNIDENLLKKITINEAITAYRFQATMEGIHNECYSLMIDNLIKDPQEKSFLFNSITT